MCCSHFAVQTFIKISDCSKDYAKYRRYFQIFPKMSLVHQLLPWKDQPVPVNISHEKTDGPDLGIFWKLVFRLLIISTRSQFQKTIIRLLIASTDHNIYSRQNQSDRIYFECFWKVCVTPSKNITSAEPFFAIHLFGVRRQQVYNKVQTFYQNTIYSFYFTVTP